MATYKGIQGYSVQKLSTDPTDSESVGQLWYNSTSGAFKISTEGAGAWATGGNYPANLGEFGAAGTQTAGLGFGGGPGSVNTCAEYDGTSWTLGGVLGTGRYANGGCGTQTSGYLYPVIQPLPGTS